jgi:hypothetical protein
MGVNCRLIWGTIPDFWSISGSGMILGGAVWVAIAKSKIKHDNLDDLERNDYEAVNTDEQTGKYNEFELGEISDNEEDGRLGSSSSSAPGTPDRNQIGGSVEREASLDVVETEDSREERQ